MALNATVAPDATVAWHATVASGAPHPTTMLCTIFLPTPHRVRKQAETYQKFNGIGLIPFTPKIFRQFSIFNANPQLSQPARKAGKVISTAQENFAGAANH
jgi:hypothetical protein